MAYIDEHSVTQEEQKFLCAKGNVLCTFYTYNDKWHCTLPNDLFDHDAVLHSILPASYKIFFQLPINRLFHPLYLYTPPPKERLYKCTQNNNSISHQEAAFATSKFGQNDDLVYCTQKPMYNSDQLIKVLNRITNDCMLSSFSLSCLMPSVRF